MNLLDEMRGTVLRPFLPETDFLTAEEELQGRPSSAESELLRLEGLVELVAELLRLNNIFEVPPKTRSFAVVIASRGVEATHTVLAPSSCEAAMIALDLTFDDGFEGELFVQVKPVRKDSEKVAA